MKSRIQCKLSKNAEVFIPLDMDHYKMVDLYEEPGRFKKITERKIMFRSVSVRNNLENFRMMSIPDLTTSDLVLHQKIGEGAFSKVYR